MIENIFISFACVSVTGSLIAAILTLAKPFTKRIFSPRWHYFVTACLVAMMLVPIRIKLPEITKSVITQNGQLQDETDIATKPAEITVLSEGADESENAVPKTLFKYTGTLSAIWLAVASVKLVWNIASYAMFISKIKRNSVTVQNHKLGLYLKRKTAVRMMSCITSPFTTGILKPMLVLPENDFSDEQLNFILAHEAIHINRFDVLVRWLAIIMKCIHWYNPAAYIIDKKLHNEGEISCDYELTLHMSKEEENGYMNTIIELAAAGNGKNHAFSTALSAKGKILERRFLMIKDKIKVSKTTAIASVIIAGSLLCTGAIASGILSDRYTKDFDSAMENNISVPDVSTENTTETDETYPTSVLDSEEETETADAEEFTLIWPCDSTEVTAPFSPERNHYATDIKAERGSDVYASLNATVADTGFESSRGNYIVLEADDISVELAHLQETCVEIGDTVTGGEVIGKVGSTGRATGPHLHYAISIDGEYVDAAELDTVELVITE